MPVIFSPCDLSYLWICKRTKPMQYQLGLVLSGGGIRGMAHIGVLKVLEENGLHPDAIAGTSAGALVGALYAAGLSADEMLDFFESTEIFKFSNYAWKKPGWLDTDKFEEVFREKLPEEDTFEALSKKLFVVATDLVQACGRTFDSGPLVKSVLASAAFPVVFSPVEIDGTLYSDGGIVNNFPVEPLHDCCGKILGVHVNFLSKISPDDIDSSFKVFQRAYEISVTHTSVEKFDRCDLVINPSELDGLFTFDMRNLEKAFEIGYEAANRQVEKLREIGARAKD